ncbi:Protein transport protein SEC9 [Candida viswanathii]|uniref:Protein transport protein SEC9 n=1 Tax=Candida viswanathii TaxID=5486 RepID=A0A367XVG2_9ASCO|nr:Protein transport protein SEC9 [Candida viswanathii]
MGIKKMFMKKDPTEEELREELSQVGIATKSNKRREEKFGAFKNYAQERAQMRPQLGPANPYANINNVGGQNPYATNGMEAERSNSSVSTATSASPYESSGRSSNPYGANTSRQSPYGSNLTAPSPYTRSTSSTSTATAGTTPYARPTASAYASSTNTATNPYGSAKNSASPEPLAQNAYTVSRMSTRQTEQPVTRTSTRQTQAYMGDTDSALDLNAMPSHQMFESKKPVRRNTQPMNDLNLDLNEEAGECVEVDDLNLDLSELQEEEQVNSEDEEVEAIKQDIKFVKQESVQSTRNTLRMAQEADASGTNTLGMLGSQSERLYGAEQNLLLAETQTLIADEKVKELRRLNRSIFMPSTNPFNKKSRLRQQEEKIKNQKEQEKYLREANRQEMFQSEQRIKQGLTSNATNSDVFNKYQDERYLTAAQRYQFENDSEDDDMEKEIALNLDQIGNYAKKLHGIANTMSTEVESQNERLKRIEENADKLDINVHMNTTRLNNIR